MKRLLSLLSLVCLFVVGTYATARIFAYDLSLTTEGTNYTFSFKANETPTSASIVFYNSTTGEYIDEVAIDSPTSGSNSKTIAQDDLPGGGTMTWGIKLHGADITTLQTVHTDNVTAYKRGFAVINTNPESDFFGRIYGIGTKVTPNFIQDYLPDYTISTKTYYFSSSSGIGNPQRSCVAKDGTLYIADYGDAHPGVFTMNPSTHALNAIFVGEGLSTASSGLITTSSSVKVASSSPACYVYGEGKDTKLYMVQEDFGTAGTSAAHPVTMYQLGQSDGSVLSTWATAPTSTYPITGHTGGNSQIIANDKGFWLCQYRANNSSEALPCLMFYNSEGTRTFSSGSTAALLTAIPGSYRGAFAISQDGTKLAINIDGTKFSLFDIEWSGSTPSLTNQTDITHSFGQMGQMAFDYAGNLIAIAGTYDTSMKLYVFATPTNNNECTVPAKKALTVYKPIANPVASVSLDQTSKTVKVGDTFTLTPTVLPADATDKTYSWSTTNADVATIADGVVTAVGVGSADITVTTTDGSKTATCAVTVEAPDPLAGSYKIGGAEADFATLYNAIDYLNNWGISGNTTFLICGNLTETRNIGLVNTSAYAITIKPDADADRTISFTQVADNTGPSGALVIGSNAANIGWAGTATRNIVIDGLASAEATHKMTIKTPSGFGATAGPIVIYGSVTNTIIRNCRIINELSPTAMCITFRNNQPTGLASTSDDYPDGIIIENNYIATPNAGNGQGIYVNGSKATTTGPSNLVIRDNEISASSRGVFLYGLNNITIDNNIIRMSAASGYDCAAIYGLTSAGNINIRNNQILSLTSNNTSETTAHGLNGIIAGSGGDWLIENNLITGFDATSDGRKGHLIGIKTGGTPSSIKILHNTFYMPAFSHTMTSALLSAKPVTLLYIAGGTPIVKNNIFISEETSCVNSLVRGALNANCTNNVFYSAGGNGVIVDGATACANWSDLCTKYSAQARTSTWQQIELTDNYKPTSTYIGNVNLAVTPLAEVTTDIEGTARSETKTYAGCYEASNIAAVYSGVSSLTLPATASVERDNTIELTPTVTPAIAANRTQFWSSDNTAVATVDNSGVVTAVAVGTAHITVTIDGITSDACTITVYRTDFAVTWEPNGATTTSTAPASNNDLWTLFMPAYNTYYSLNRGVQAITAVATFANAKMQEFMTDPESPWKWLGDYMLSVATAQGYTLDTEQKWRFCAQAFFNCAEADVYAINAPDFTTAGQIANWLPLWKEANNYLPPTMRATDEMPVISKDNDRLVGWYDNSEFEGEPVTSVTEDITLYALWDEPIELDEESSDNIGTIEANDGNLANVVLRRPFTANGYWYTLVLPFDVTAEQLAETFGAGTEVTVLQSSYKKSETAIYLNFVKQATIQAGVPCLFKPGKDIEEVAVFRDVTINNTTPQKSTALVNMVGLYAPDDVELNDNNYYLGNTNYLHEYVELYQNTKGFRAYFHFNETLSAGCAPRVMFHEDTTTELEDITETTSPIVEKVIRNGQLIIIRDGKEFNAQGQLIQ